MSPPKLQAPAIADKVQAGAERTHEKDARRVAGVFKFSCATRLGARVADGAAVVDAGAVGFGRARVQLLDFRTDPLRGLQLIVLGQGTSSCFLLFRSSVYKQGAGIPTL